MIGLKKEPINRSVKRKTVVFDRFFTENTISDGAAALGLTGGTNSSLLLNGALCAKTSSNCDFSGKALKPCVGAEIYYTTAGNSITTLQTDSVKNIFCVRLQGSDGMPFERYLFAWSNGYVRLYSEESRSFVLGVPVGDNVRGAYLRSVDGEERFLIVGSEKSMFFKSDEAFYPSGYSNLTSVLCVCKNRLFVVLQDGRLAYSDPSVPWDISESIDNGGYVKLPPAYGQPIELIAVGEYVYVFFLHAIMRLTVKGSAREFFLEESSYNGGKIIKGTICALSDGAVFLTNDGELWTVKKKDAQTLCKDLSLYLKRQETGYRAAVYKGKYFLHYKNVKASVRSIVVDLDGGSWSNCFDLGALSTVEGAPLFVRSGTLYQLGSEVLLAGEPCTFESVETDFGMRGRKILRRVDLSGHGTITLKVYCDGQFTRHSVSLLEGRASVVLNARGENFSFHVEIGSRSYLRSMSVELEG